jgi:predicted nucleic acid-binding Zn ribbon protein
MPRRTRDEPDDDDWDDGYDADRDYDPDDTDTYPEGLYDDGGPPEVPCPYCRAPIPEDTPRCPECGNYISREDAPPGGPKTNWWVVMTVLALLTALMWVAGG